MIRARILAILATLALLLAMLAAIACANAAPWEPCPPPFTRVPVLGANNDTVGYRVVCP